MKKYLLLFFVFSLVQAQVQAQPTQHINMTRIGDFPLGNAEIVSFANQHAYVTNATDNTIDVIDLADPASPVLSMQIQINPFGAVINSVAVKNGIVAAAVEANIKQDPGKIVFFDAATGDLLHEVTVGALPDMVIFTPNGQYVLSANEGEPSDDYTHDPEGSVSIIDIQNGVTHATVTTVGFTDFNNGQARHNELPTNVRIFGPNASVAQDLEPEYIAISADGTKAYVSLQENNAIATIDIANGHIDRIDALGFKDYSLAGNGIDASDKDGEINIQNWPVFGMYQPDSIATYAMNGTNYIVTANEGDARDYGGFSEEDRVKDLNLNSAVFPNTATLQEKEKLGRLKVTTTLGDTDADPNDVEEIYSYGARSFSIWNASTGQLVFDSGDQFAQTLKTDAPGIFNQNGPGEFDKRSDDKGAEPEALDLAFMGGRVYALIGLERVGGVMIYDITDPNTPEFQIYLPPETLGGVTDNAPEGIKFITNADSPNDRPLVLIAHEKSNNLAIYQLDVCTVSNLQLLSNQLTITGSCLDGGVDLYQRINGVDTLIQSGIIVDGAASVTIANANLAVNAQHGAANVIISNLSANTQYFVAVSGSSAPINGIIISAAQSASAIPMISVLGLLLMGGLLPFIVFVTTNRKRRF